MTPEQAWEHVKALWPEATHMEARSDGAELLVMLGPTCIARGECNIDWPECVDRWPIMEAEYREPMMPQDCGKEIEVRDDERENWIPAKLAGLALESNFPWFTHLGVKWRYARIRVTPEVAPEVTPEVATCKESSQVDPVAWREVTR